MNTARLDEHEFEGGNVVYLGISDAERTNIRYAASQITSHITPGQRKTILLAMGQANGVLNANDWPSNI